MDFSGPAGIPGKIESGIGEVDEDEGSPSQDGVNQPEQLKKSKDQRKPSG